MQAGRPGMSVLNEGYSGLCEGAEEEAIRCGLKTGYNRLAQMGTVKRKPDHTAALVVAIASGWSRAAAIACRRWRWADRKVGKMHQSAHYTLRSRRAYAALTPRSRQAVIRNTVTWLV